MYLEYASNVFQHHSSPITSPEFVFDRNCKWNVKKYIISSLIYKKDNKSPFIWTYPIFKYQSSFVIVNVISIYWNGGLDFIIGII